jgi:hypothetical protein
MLSREGDDPAHGLSCHTLEYLGSNLLGRMVVSVFEDRPNWETRAFHQPRARHLASDPFNVGALAPVNHCGLH